MSSRECLSSDSANSQEAHNHGNRPGGKGKKSVIVHWKPATTWIRTDKLLQWFVTHPQECIHIFGDWEKQARAEGRATLTAKTSHAFYYRQVANYIFLTDEEPAVHLDYLNSSDDPSWAKCIHGRVSELRKAYGAIRMQMASTGFGITEEDRANNIYTIDDKLFGTTFPKRWFEQLDALCGKKPSLTVAGTSSDPGQDFRGDMMNTINTMSSGSSRFTQADVHQQQYNQVQQHDTLQVQQYDTLQAQEREYDASQVQQYDASQVQDFSSWLSDGQSAALQNDGAMPSRQQLGCPASYTATDTSSLTSMSGTSGHLVMPDSLLQEQGLGVQNNHSSSSLHSLRGRASNLLLTSSGSKGSHKSRTRSINVPSLPSTIAKSPSSTRVGTTKRSSSDSIAPGSNVKKTCTSSSTSRALEPPDVSTSVESMTAMVAEEQCQLDEKLKRQEDATALRLRARVASDEKDKEASVAYGKWLDVYSHALTMGQPPPPLPPHMSGSLPPPPPPPMPPYLPAGQQYDTYPSYSAAAFSSYAPGYMYTAGRYPPYNIAPGYPISPAFLSAPTATSTSSIVPPSAIVPAHAIVPAGAIIPQVAAAAYGMNIPTGAAHGTTGSAAAAFSANVPVDVTGPTAAEYSVSDSTGAAYGTTGPAAGSATAGYSANVPAAAAHGTNIPATAAHGTNVPAAAAYSANIPAATAHHTNVPAATAHHTNVPTTAAYSTNVPAAAAYSMNIPAAAATYSAHVPAAAAAYGTNVPAAAATYGTNIPAAAATYSAHVPAGTTYGANVPAGTAYGANVPTGMTGPTAGYSVSDSAGAAYGTSAPANAAYSASIPAAAGYSANDTTAATDNARTVTDAHGSAAAMDATMLSM
ncbi:hypothetical protein DAEQUDRAFT_768058 [Daedalea quercina L-15889]|uniref:Uncharacterized protein n=1 Tax=Daedalea quercina L-15889 TaxID=1314783 RepID=A0A165N0L4_9APHY|nr:hypothetical protein DAEQUDRAFT_768058 [Daedalea quercina L-15889]